jgi:GT2 family glycosyltransferase
MSNRLPDNNASSARGPIVSVVIPTFNRRASLGRLLESLARQTLPTALFEVIVVDDGSTDDTANYVRELQRERTNLFLFSTANHGPASARNSGAFAAKGYYLAFTDDDCVADEHWLGHLVEAFRETGAIGIQGKTISDRRSKSPLTHEMEVAWSWVTTMPTCNAAYTRSAFNAVGGFDDSFKVQFNEDADLAWRIEDLGKLVYAPSVIINHPPRRDSFWKKARWVRVYEADFTLFYKNKRKYRAYKSWSPWSNIYWNMFVVNQSRMLKSYMGYLVRRPVRPHYFLIGVALTLVRSFNMIRYFPLYFRSYSSNRRKFDSQAGAQPPRNTDA